MQTVSAMASRSPRLMPNEMLNVNSQGRLFYKAVSEPGGAGASGKAMKELNQKELLATLAKLSEWRKTSDFVSHWFSFDNVDWAAAINNTLQGKPLDVSVQFHPYPDHESLKGFFFNVVNSSAWALLNDNSILVYPSGSNAAVPFVVNKAIAAAFLAAFSTRVVLQELLAELMPKAGLDLDKWVSVGGGLDVAAWGVAASYDHSSVNTFLGSIPRIEIKSPLNPVSWKYGWQAAAALLSGEGNEPFIEAARALIRHRFSAYNLGLICSYVINGIAGYAQSGGVGRDAGLDNLQILGAFGNLPASVPRELSVTVPAILTQQLIGYCRDPKNESRVTTINMFGEFLTGWNAGAAQAADWAVLYAFNIGYEMGFQNGFREGYSRGYADGFREGYKAGWTEAWASANVQLEQLRRELAHARKEAQWGSTIASLLRGLVWFLGVAVAKTDNSQGIKAAKRRKRRKSR